MRQRVEPAVKGGVEPPHSTMEPLGHSNPNSWPKKEPAVYPYTAGIAFLVTPSSAKRRRWDYNRSHSQNLKFNLPPWRSQ